MVAWLSGRHGRNMREDVSDSVQNRERGKGLNFSRGLCLSWDCSRMSWLEGPRFSKSLPELDSDFSFVLAHCIALAGNGFSCLAGCSGLCGPHCLSLTWPPLARGVQLLSWALLLLLRLLAPEPHPPSLVN